MPNYKLAELKSLKLIQKLMPLEAALTQLYLPSVCLIVLPQKKLIDVILLLKLLLNFQN